MTNEDKVPLYITEIFC